MIGQSEDVLMKAAASYRFHRRALAARDELSDEDQTLVEQALVALPSTSLGR
jgi:hypothetical protein